MLTPEVWQFWMATPSVCTKTCYLIQGLYIEQDWQNACNDPWYTTKHNVSQDLQRSWRRCRTRLAFSARWGPATQLDQVHLDQVGTWFNTDLVVLMYLCACSKQLKEYSWEVHKYCVLQCCMLHIGTYRGSDINIFCHSSLPIFYHLYKIAMT